MFLPFKLETGVISFLKALNLSVGMERAFTCLVEWNIMASGGIGMEVPRNKKQLSKATLPCPHKNNKFKPVTL